METSETKYVRYQVDVEWTAVSYSENRKSSNGQQLSVANRFKEKLDIIFDQYPGVGQVDLYLLGNSSDEEEKEDKTEIDYVYRYGVEAIIFDGHYDEAPGRKAFKNELIKLLADDKKVIVKEVDSWNQRNPQVKFNN